MYARSFIDSLDFASNGQVISGEVPVSELQRLQDMLANQQGKLAYRIQGGVDDQGNHYLDLSVTGHCQLSCQRCLEGMDYPVQLDTRLILRDQAGLDAEESLAGQPGHQQEFDSILAEVNLDVLNLLEDEMLLSLPIAPRHEQGTCQATGSNNMQQEKRQPFAELANFKRNLSK